MISLRRIVRYITYRNSTPTSYLLYKDIPGEEYGKRTISGDTVLLWKCPNGPDHEWKMTASEVVTGFLHNQSHRFTVLPLLPVDFCPFCSGRRVSITNNLSARFPEIAHEWDCSRNDTLPSQISYGSTKKIEWKCPVGEDHVFVTSPNRRTDSLQSDCPYCLDLRPSTTTSLQRLYPEIAKEWDRDKNKASPETCSSKSRLEVWWKCQNGHIWQESVLNRTSKHSCCPMCKDKGCVSLSQRCRKLLRNWDYQKNDTPPNTISIGTSKKYYWKCEKCHRSFQAAVNVVVTNFFEDKRCVCKDCY